MAKISIALSNMMIKLVEKLTAGGGVTAPDDMVNIDDVAAIIEDFVPTEANEQKHAEIVEGLTELYIRKNRDYGGSFAQGMKKYGMIMPIIRMEDKLNRITSLVTSGKQNVTDESLRDSLLDLANYAIMTVIEIDMKGEQQ